MGRIFKAKDRQILGMKIPLNLQFFKDHEEPAPMAREGAELGEKIAEGFKAGIKGLTNPAPKDPHHDGDRYDSLRYGMEAPDYKEMWSSTREHNLKLIQEMEKIKRERDLWKDISTLFYIESKALNDLKAYLEEKVKTCDKRIATRERGSNYFDESQKIRDLHSEAFYYERVLEYISKIMIDDTKETRKKGN